MTRLVLCLVAWAPAAAAVGQANLVSNPGFENDTDADGVPDGWRWSGSTQLVSQTLTSERGRQGGRSGRLTCTRFTGGGSSAHAMICQMGVPVERGKTYRVALWARGEAIEDQMVSIALSDTAVWSNCGLDDVFVPTPRWKPYEFVFRATRDCSRTSRFQIWFTSTGTLWLDDVVFEEAGRELYRPGHVVAAVGRKNLVPSASFECGSDGWGSAEWDRTTHWGGKLNRLFGEIDDAESFHGRASLRIDLGPENQPVSYFDWYELHRTPIRAPLAANLGWIEVEPGRRYTFSVYMKARRPGTPARLAVRQFDGRPFETAVRVSADWQRQALSFVPTSRWCYVLAGPDLRPTDENPDPPERATLWLDAVQLEQGDRATEFQPRLPVEFGIWTDKPGNVFGWDEAPRVGFAVVCHQHEPRRPAKLELRLTDFFDQEIWRAPVAGPSALDRLSSRRFAGEVSFDVGDRHRGFLRLHAKMTAGQVVSERTMRLAVIPIHCGDDSRFGINHAYPWPHLLDLCRKAGLIWMRDWSLKWQEVEPEKGHFTFDQTDYQINRPLEHGLQVLAMAPFPSSNWSSESPPSVKVTDRYPQNRARVAYAPRDVGEFETYVGRTVSQYKDRIRWWQVFNEPVYTSYSLPRARGYDGGDYARLTQAFVRAARRADPKCRILAGIGGLREGQNLEDFRQFFAAGGLEAVDAVDIHHYPRIRPPEFIEGLLQKLNALMDAHGGRKPIWLTEYGYYADDEPSSLPMRHSGHNRPLESEQLQAEYAVRWATIMFAGGVEKVFYHAGTCDAVNSDSLQGIFYEYAGCPHKIYAAQAVMSHLLTPTARFVKQLPLGDGLKGYLFRDGRRLVAVVWATAEAKPRPIRLASDEMQLWDLMGRPQPSRQFTPSGTPVYIISDDLPDEAFQLE